VFLERIIAKNFRNYSDLDLNLKKDKHLNIINSPNGMGKSNLLEIIYYLCYFRSFRNASDKELIKKGESFYFIQGIYSNNNIKNDIKIKYSIKKNILYNDKNVRRYSELFGSLLSVLFCNEDIFIINGPPSIKRKFFDIFISIIDKKYLDCLKKYYSILKQKNFLLKQNNNVDLIKIYNIQLAKIIVYIIKCRQNLIENINNIFVEKFQEIGLFKEKVKIIYLPSIKEMNNIDNESIVLNILDKNLKKELNFGYSLIGPHRDNYIFLMSGIPFQKFASFGQTRLAALVLKLVKTEYLIKEFNIYPILLLDDVILELDREKQRRFINIISDYNQIFITLSNNEYIDLFLKKSDINNIEVLNGKIK